MMERCTCECSNLIHNFYRKEKYNYTEIDTKKNTPKKYVGRSK